MTGTKSPSPIGGLKYYGNANGGAYLSPDWLLCDGSLVSKTTYSVLYARIGLVNYGSWVTITDPIGDPVNAMAYGGGRYVAGCYNESNVASSTDGITWSNIASPGTGNIVVLAYGGGKFAVGDNGGNISTSTDGITWGATATVLPGQIQGLVYGMSKWVAVGNSGTMATSTDGTTWTRRYLDTSNNFNAIATSTSKLVAVGASYAGGQIPPALETSTDAIHWYSTTPSIGGGLTGGSGSDGGPALSWDGAKFVGVGGGVGPFSSTNGVDWTAITQSFPFSSGLAIKKGGSYYMMTGPSGVVAWSPDAVTWTSLISGTSNNISALLYTSGNKWTYGADAGVVGTTTDITVTTFTPTFSYYHGKHSGTRL